MNLSITHKSKIINHLIDDDYLNEVRFTKSFIQGKLRIKKWGRIKLNYELKMRGVKKFIIDEEINKIKEELSNNFKSKIKLNYNHDKSLIGGLVVQVGSTMIDTSIKNKLQQIENRMIEA